MSDGPNNAPEIVGRVFDRTAKVFGKQGETYTQGEDQHFTDLGRNQEKGAEYSAILKKASGGEELNERDGYEFYKWVYVGDAHEDRELMLSKCKDDDEKTDLLGVFATQYLKEKPETHRLADPVEKPVEARKKGLWGLLGRQRKESGS